MEAELNIIRIIDAPREIVFKAWTSAGHLSNWYAPGSCAVTIYKLEFMPGGIFQHKISNEKGDSYVCKGEYVEIIAPEKIVYKLSFCDEAGSFIYAADVQKDWPDETTVTVTFEEDNDSTKLTLHQTVSKELAKQTGAYQGWLEMLDKLEIVSKKLETK